MQKGGLVTVNKHLLASASFLWAFLSGTALAQQCSHVNGQWNDNYGMVWNLSHYGGGVLGWVYTNYLCGQPLWNVNGSLQQGHIGLFASNPNWSDTCAMWFEYDGDIGTGGCNTGTGGWYNDYGYVGSFLMSKSCEIPPYESTYVGFWTGPNHVFSVVMSNTSGGDLSGRYIRETDYATGHDSCWYSGSPIPKFDGVTQPNPFVLSANNAYTDTIGFGSTAVNHYRSHGDAPCSAHIYQQMQIACGWPGFETYHGVQNNILIAEIGTTTVTSTRDGVQAGPITY
jgi:hypothetical protein